MAQSAQYLVTGFHLLRKKSIRIYVIIPMMINMLLLTSASFWFLQKVSHWKQQLYDGSYAWVQTLLDYVGWLLWPIIILILLIGFIYLFSILANLIASPFNSLLSEAIEEHLSGETSPQFNFTSFVKEFPAIISREIIKLLYWLPRALLFGLLFFIPVINFFAPVIWFLFSAWMLSIQYMDYPADNNKIPFKQLVHQLSQQRGSCLIFGGLIAFFMIIPIINIIVMPIAVAGATVYWHHELKAHLIEK